MTLASILLAVMVFRSAYEQVGNTVALWADRGINREIAPGWTIPMTWFQSLNPLLVFLLTPLFVRRWIRLARQGREPSSLRKMATGAGAVALSFLVLAAVCAWADWEGVRVSALWLLVFFAMLTAGELGILPVGLGLFGRLAPTGKRATTIATWFFAAFAGNFLAGALGTLWSQLVPATFFLLTGAVAALAGTLLVLMDRPASHVEPKATPSSSPVL